MKIDIVNPYGFCKGVEYAVNKVLDIAKKSNGPVFCVNQLVHNKYVMEKIKQSGIIVLEGNKEEIINKVSSGTIVFSAHGTSNNLLSAAKSKGLNVIDLVCPYVLKEFKIIEEKIKNNYDVIYIGLKKHEESEAAISISSSIHLISSIEDIDRLEIKNDKIAVINQTTLSISSLKYIHEKLKQKYPNIEIIDEICDSTRTRQEKSLIMASHYDKVIVVGDSNSNNAKSLFEIIKSENKDVLMVESKKDLESHKIDGGSSILICSSASTSKETVHDVYNYIIEANNSRQK